jgi:hypothetical protein
VARRNQVVRHRTQIKNEVHAMLHAHLIPPPDSRVPPQISGYLSRCQTAI